MRYFDLKRETGRIRGNPIALGSARAIPSRSRHGWRAGVETRRGCGIAHHNTPIESGSRKAEEIVQPRRNADKHVQVQKIGSTRGPISLHIFASQPKDTPARKTSPGICPAEGCELCAEKHLSTAYALAGEAGYVAINRQRIIGELTAAALHLYKAHPELAESIRAARHLIQQRREAEVDWNPLLAEIDAMATAETLEDTIQTTKKEA